MKPKCLYTGCDVMCDGLVHHGDLVTCNGVMEVEEYTCDGCGNYFLYGELNSEIYNGVRKELCDKCFMREELTTETGDNE